MPKLLLPVTRVTTDIAEHRHLREGLAHLARWADGLSDSSRIAAGHLRVEERRWGPQVFERRHLPRILELEGIAGRAEGLAREMRRAIRRHPFLREAGPPRTPFGPTPVFRGRTPYREAYRALREARRRFGLLVDAEGSLRVRYRRFSVLYEYWCFIRVVKALRERLGHPQVHGGYSLVDEVYRPELEAGQSYLFHPERGLEVEAIYEPEFPPAGSRRGARFVASLVTGPLRPDVVVEVRRDGRPPAMLVLDAKSTRSFDREDLWRPRDYRALIHDAQSGWQPVRQLFLLHAGSAVPPICNLPGYLDGRSIPPETSVLGALPCLPGLTGPMERALERFLETWAGP